MLHLPHLYVGPSKRGGRGVFTSRAVEKASIVELAPALVLSAEDREIIHQTRLHDYYFLWGGEGAAIALGYGSLYNHSAAPNVEYELDYDFDQIRFTTLRAVEPGEELLIDYLAGGGEELWFRPHAPGKD